ncbi:hypothetical protein FE257_009453 [Aspergillus nanangensis]|uniref:Xylanolytic transcriptional activator regulatory domain-containing protein n=1 Tax=Aspergillus nanangensis TaxID=2582783 RepID=A0AAD4CJY5_ASPNN|nr:hypothetical protein FE257_009453 [Aspergillus nanangensis]
MSTRSRLIMINRLETNIERMEARLQELGFDLGHEILTESDDMETFPSPPLPQYDNPTGEEFLEADMGDVGDPFTHVDPTSTHGQVEENMLPDDLGSFFFPRSLVDMPVTGGISSLSPEGKEWILRKAGVAASSQGFSSVPSSKNTRQFSLRGVFPNTAFSPVPPREEAISLLDDYLEGFNTLCPLYQRSALIPLFHDGKLDIKHQPPGRWATINVILGLGYMLRIKDRSVAQTDHQKSWMFIKNALGVVNDLYLGPPDLWAIQSLLGMTIFLLGTCSTQPCSFLISTAVRMSHQIGLERSVGVSRLCPEEGEQRRRVFWITYCLDREISLRFSKPFAQRDEDMDVNLPMETFGDNLDIQQIRFDAFRSMCQLSMIKSQLYKRLYSAAAMDRPLNELAVAVGMLDEELQRWKESIPFEYRPEELVSSAFSQFPVSLALLYLHYSYFDCVISIHRLTAKRARNLMSAVQDCGLDAKPTTPSNPRVYMSASLCAKAARASIDLMRYIPQGNICVVGIMIHYPIVASMTLSWCIIRNPLDVSRAYDMKLIARVERFLASLVLGTPNEIVKRLVKFCAKYRGLAETAINGTGQA